MHSLFFHRLTSAIEDYSDHLEPTAEQLDYFIGRHARSHYFVSSTELIAAIDAGEKLDPRWIHLSMDDGFASSLDAARICQRHKVPLAVFVTSDVIRGFNPWFNRRVAALIQNHKSVYYNGQRYDTADAASAPLLHNAIKQEVYSHPALEQNRVISDILARIGLVEKPVPEKLRFMTADELRDLRSTGADVGGHGATHISLVDLPSEAISYEIVESKQYLESVIGEPLRFFSHPEGLYDQKTIEAVRAAGYVGAFAVRPTLDDKRYAIPRVGVSADLGTINLPQPVSAKRSVAAENSPYAILTSVPMAAPAYCEVIHRVREKFPGTLIVARTTMTADEARKACPDVKVVQSKPAVAAKPRGLGFVDRLVLSLAGSGLAAVRRKHLVAYFTQEYGRCRLVNKFGVVRSIMATPGRVYGVRFLHQLGSEVDQLRSQAFHGQPLGPTDADMLFPADGDLDALAEELAARKITLLLQLGWGRVSKKLLSIPTFSWHHGIMPQIRGMASPAWSVIMNRPDWLGLTIQELDAGLDTGRIVSSTRLDPKSVSSYAEAYVALDRIANDELLKAVEAFQAGRPYVTNANPEPLSGVYLNIPGWREARRFQRESGRFFGKAQSRVTS